jgi:PAS domain S-box-containing protein
MNQNFLNNKEPRLILENIFGDENIFLDAPFDRINVSIGFHDRFGIITYVNDTLCTLTGIERKSIVGRNINEFIDPDRCLNWLEKINNMPAFLPEPVELKFNPPLHNKKILSSQYVVYDRDGGVAGAFFVLSDISEHSNCGKYLHIDDEKFSKAFHASPAPSTISTLEEGQYIDVNESFARLVGYNGSELIGRYVWEVGLFLKWSDRVAMIGKLKRDGKLRDYELLLNSRTGGIRNFSVSAEIIELQGKKCMVWVGYDITEKIKLEKEILSISERERYRVGQYLHDDLGQFLVGIEAMCSLLQKKLKRDRHSSLPLAAEMNEYIREAIENARRTAQGLCPVKLEENGLRFAIKDLVTKTSRMFNISCEFYDAADVIIYSSDTAINMFYIVQESVNNAVKHSRAESITVSFITDEDRIILVVRDNGRGFDISSLLAGGLGLDIMKYRARAIGAALNISSEPGKGTEVELVYKKVNNRKADWDWKGNSIFDYQGN